MSDPICNLLEEESTTIQHLHPGHSQQRNHSALELEFKWTEGNKLLWSAPANCTKSPVHPSPALISTWLSSTWARGSNFSEILHIYHPLDSSNSLHSPHTTLAHRHCTKCRNQQQLFCSRKDNFFYASYYMTQAYSIRGQLVSERVQNSFDSHPENALYLCGPLCLSYEQSQGVQGALTCLSARETQASCNTYNGSHNNSKEVQVLHCDKRRWTC